VRLPAQDEAEVRHGRAYRVSEKGFAWLLTATAARLPGCSNIRVHADHSAVDDWIEFLSYRIIPKGFFPQQDTGAMIGMVQDRRRIVSVMDNSVRQLVM